MYDLINQDTANKIKEIMLFTKLNNSIKFKFMNNDIELDTSNVSVASSSKHFDYNMNEIFLLDEDGTDNVIKSKNKFYNLFINIGEWGYDTRLNETHITVGSSKFHAYCFQIELSDAFEDDKYIYIVKNIQNLAGKGAIVRLYKGLKNNRSEKENRKQEFIKRFEHETIYFDSKKWICINKINKADLLSGNNREEIFYSLIKNILTAMMLVENIAMSPVVNTRK